MQISQKISHDNDITFDDSPLDASEGQTFIHKRSTDDLDGENSNDEHWLWSNVNRIKRSINTVFGHGNEQSESKRVKRGWFDDPWFPLPSSSPDGETTTTQAPFNLFNWGNLNNDEKTTTKASEVQQPASMMHRAQADDSRHVEEDEDEDANTEDDDNDIDDGSGFSKIEETETVYRTTLERFCKFKGIFHPGGSSTFLFSQQKHFM